MASLFEYEKEAIRIKVTEKDEMRLIEVKPEHFYFQARRTDSTKDEYRKFSVDPNITSFEVLQSILCRLVFVRVNKGVY